MYNNIEYFKKNGVKKFVDIGLLLDNAKILKGGCLVSDNSFHLEENPQVFINRCSCLIEEGGLFLLSDTVVDKLDAVTNTNEFFKNKLHRRFYRVEEIIDFTKHFFKLDFFSREGDQAIFIFVKL